jgi:hypothetical protein
VVPGSRTDWREICVSELRVLGTPGASAAAGSTPTFRLAPATGEAIATDATGDEPSAEELAEEVLEDLAADVSVFEGEWLSEHLREPVAALLAAESPLQARIDAAGSALPAELSCDWPSARMRVRLARMSEHFTQINDEQVQAMRQVDGLPTSQAAIDREAARIEARMEASSEAIDALDRMEEPESALAVARRVLAARAPTVPDYDLAEEWGALRSAAERVAATCARR